MTTPSAKFAFQIEGNQTFSDLTTSSDTFLGSKKEEVTLKDGSKKKITVFFAAEKEVISKLQEKAEARSNKQTVESFRKFCMSTQENLTPTMFALGMRQIKEGREGTVKLNNQRSALEKAAEKIRLDYDKNTAVPFNSLRKKFVDATEAGVVLRVNKNMTETPFQPSIKTKIVTDFTAEEAARYHNRGNSNSQDIRHPDVKASPVSTTQASTNSIGNQGKLITTRRPLPDPPKSDTSRRMSRPRPSAKPLPTPPIKAKLTTNSPSKGPGQPAAPGSAVELPELPSHLEQDDI